MIGPSDPSPGAPRRRPPVGGLTVLLVLSAALLFWAGFGLGTLAPGAGRPAALEPLIEAFERIEQEYVGAADSDTLVEGAMEGLFDALDDPYSAYLTPEEYEEGLRSISGEFEGIGAHLGALTGSGATCATFGADCRLHVVRVVSDSPAEAAGLEAGDLIVAIDGDAVDGETMDAVIDRYLRGPKGTAVDLELDRGEERQELSITREVVRSEDVRSSLLADGQVGYLRVNSFSGSAAADLRDELEGQVKAGVTHFIVNLRGDPGGLVQAAVEVASQFVASGPIYWEEVAGGDQRAVEALSGGLATGPDIRVAVLIDGATASASEIVAGALQDDDRATLVGQTTFGKGTVQDWVPLSGGAGEAGGAGGFRLSIARWLTPSRASIHLVGISPDVEVAPGPRWEPGIDGVQPEDDPQVRRALEVVVASLGASSGASPSTSPGESAAPGPSLAPAPSEPDL